MEKVTPVCEKAPIESLPANSSWWKFFVTMYFGRNYFRFSGRASRKEYWGTSILFGVLSLIVGVIVSFLFVWGKCSVECIGLAANIVRIYGFIPCLALMSRRFHDINMRAWWCLLFIPLFFLPFFKGDRKDNRFGKNIY